VGDEDKAAFVRELGAEFVINYRNENVAEAALQWTEGAGVDVALDTVGPEVFRQTIPAVAHYGALVTRTRNLRIGFELMLTPMLRHLPEARAHQGEILRRCGEWMEQGRLRVHVNRTFPLSEAAAAHRLIGEGHVQGKLVLTPD